MLGKIESKKDHKLRMRTIAQASAALYTSQEDLKAKIEQLKQASATLDPDKKKIAQLKEDIKWLGYLIQRIETQIKELQSGGPLDPRE